MVAHEVPFVGNSTLSFSWTNITNFFTAYKLKTLADFDNFWRKNAETLELDDCRKMVSIGLKRRGNTVTPEEVDDGIEEFMENGNTVLDLLNLIHSAQLAALVPTDVPGESKGAMKAKPPKPSKNLST